MKKVMERTKGNIFCRLPALLLCVLLLSACGSGDTAAARQRNVPPDGFREGQEPGKRTGAKGRDAYAGGKAGRKGITRLYNKKDKK